MPKVHHVTRARVGLAADDVARATDAVRALAVRGISAELCSLENALDAPLKAVAYAPAEAPTPERAAALAPVCRALAAESRPVVMLAAFPPPPRRRSEEQAAALACLRAHGAVECRDPDTWLEAIVMLTFFGCPVGPRTAIVAPSDSWLSASAMALAREAAVRGARFSTVYYNTDKVGHTDVVLVDRAELPRKPPTRAQAALILPIVGRAELLSEDRAPALVGLRAGLGAASAVGQFAERLTDGLGPRKDTSSLNIDTENFERRLSRVGSVAGDHETKLLLAAYGVRVTRQIVATTPSAAARKARDVGWPVQIKPWGPDVPSEDDGCPLEIDVTSAAEVRRAFSAVSRQAGSTAGAAVIVRETPPAGRRLSVTFRRIGPLGLVALLKVPGVVEVIAAAAPLRDVDAALLCRHVEATRAGDLEPDRGSLAELLIRASAMIADCPRIQQLNLSGVIAASHGDDAVVVDARTILNGDAEAHEDAHEDEDEDED